MRVRAKLCASTALILFALASCGDDFEPAQPDPDSGTDGSAGTAGSSGGNAGHAGDTGTDGGAGAGGSAGIAGAAGTGGTPGTWKCVPVQDPFAIVTPTDVGASATISTSSLALVRAPLTVHVGVVVENGGQYTLLARTIQDNGKISAARTWSAGNGSPMSFSDGVAISSEVSFFGSVGSSLKKVSFEVDQTGVTPAPASASDLPTPNACSSVRAAHFSFASSADYRAAVTCDDATSLSLHVGGSSSNFSEVDSGDTLDQSVIARGYVYSGNRHLIQHGGAIYRFGTTAAELATPHQLSLTSAADSVTMALKLLPLKPPTEGSVVIAGAVHAQNLAPATLYSAALLTSQYADLGTSTPASFKPVASIDSASQMPKFHDMWPWSVDDDSIVAAGPTFAQDRLLFWMFDRTGKLLVFNHEVYKAPSGTTILEAKAVQLGFFELAVWFEQTSGSIRVMGQRLQCAAQ